MLTRDAIGGTPGFGHAIVTVDVVVLSGRIFPVGRDLHLGRAFDNSDKTKKKTQSRLFTIFKRYKFTNLKVSQTQNRFVLKMLQYIALTHFKCF